MPGPSAARRFACGALPLHALEWNPGGTVPAVLLHGWLDHAHSFDPVCEALLRGVEAPVQLLLGDRGHLAGEEKAAELDERVACLHAGPTAWLPGGHHVHLEQPAEVARALAAWVPRHG